MVRSAFSALEFLGFVVTVVIDLVCATVTSLVTGVVVAVVVEVWGVRPGLISGVITLTEC